MASPETAERLRAALSRGGDLTSDHDLNPGIVLPATRRLSPAAVLVGIASGPEGDSVVLTKRSSRLVHHPGQVAFPGGKLESFDGGPEDAALREAREEIGLPPHIVEVIGSLPAHETITGFSVTPIVARITGEFTEAAEAGEVAEIFRVPFAHVTDLSRFRVEGRRWRGTRRLYYTVPWGPYYIWGATARILRGLAERLA